MSLEIYTAIIHTSQPTSQPANQKVSQQAIQSVNQ